MLRRRVNSLRGIREVSPEEEKEGYGGKDLQKRKVLRCPRQTFATSWNGKVSRQG